MWQKEERPGDPLRYPRGSEAERHSQLQVKSFQKLSATAKDRRSVCKQTTKSHNTLRHVLTHLSDGLRSGAGLLRFFIPFQERGSLALDLERPRPSSVLLFSPHPNASTNPLWVYFLPSFPAGLQPHPVSGAHPSSQTLPGSPCQQGAIQTA